MEVSRLSELVPYLSNFFCTIPRVMLLRLENSLLLLKRSQLLNSLFYLGRVEAETGTYQLAFGSPEEDLFQQQKFFYSHNGIDWYSLIEPPSWSCDWGRLHQPFHGDLSYSVKMAEVKVSEQARLWYVVHAILRDAALVPRGVLRWTTEKEAVLNPFFRGLPEEEAGVLGNYQHFRQPERAAEENLRGRSECDLSLDVFDRAEVDVLPEGKGFALRSEEGTGRLTTWSSLYWMGLVNFHRANSNVYGFFYSGDGRKNWDVPFMIDL